ncbi:response regulator [Microlunatus speluncae]|uniref:response regulator n=1 Tax=Microlunatus speluncae TaxID=2594267 RepID=UPI00126683A1|nr:response regulator transcription factor [Microlunatus speluncae]
MIGADQVADAGRVRVLIADDEALIRAGVRAVLDTDPRIAVVAEVADGHGAIEQTRRHRPQVLLLDLQLPDLDGISAAVEIARQVPETKIVVLTTFGADDNIRRALTAGVVGFVLKASDPRELIMAVHAAADGAAYLSPRVAERVIARFRSTAGDGRAAADRVGRLTRREREVLALLSDGSSNAEIGRRLHLVEGTVKAHVSAILIKLEVANRVQAALLGYEAGLTRR